MESSKHQLTKLHLQKAQISCPQEDPTGQQMTFLCVLRFNEMWTIVQTL